MIRICARRRRIAAAAMLSLALAPGLWWRSASPASLDAPGMTAQPLGTAIIESAAGRMTLTGAWIMESDDPQFGSYSALLALPDDRLLAFSDTGYFAEFGDPGMSLAPVRIGNALNDGEHRKTRRDIEAATRDPDTGRVWLAYEGTNTIRRAAAVEEDWQARQPPEMSEWPANSGAEAMARLADGSFVVLAEGESGLAPEGRPGLFFPGDPVDGAEAISFRFAPPDDYRPTDMALLPDGRVLILLRAVRLPLPPFFRTKLVLADPATIEPGELWEWQPVADITEPVPQDNYEGLAIAPGEGGAVTLWLISDDNGAVLQRSLLLKLSWDVPPR